MKLYMRSAGFFCLLFMAATAVAQSNTTRFTGLWVLDREKTNTVKGFPEQLKDYKMLVNADQDRLMVKSVIVGSVEVRAIRSGTGGSISTSGSRTTAPSPNGVMATSGASVGSDLTAGKANYGGTMALYFTPGEITYDMSGKELKIEPAKNDKVNGLTRIKAKPGKDGRTMEFTIIRQMKGSAGEIETITRESWRLSEDAQSLKFYRTVETPTVRDEIIMTMKKGSGQ